MSWVQSNSPAILLAPMEGVTDFPMRELLSSRKGFTFCVTEFLRISDGLLPPKTYREHMPELTLGSKTATGMPVQLQLLGGNAERIALSAVRGVECGAQAIDLNFGCPAPLVNRHDGGAALLRDGPRLETIVRAVRTSVPKHIPVSAKLRLGFDDERQIYKNVEHAVRGGAEWITIHARTKVQGYRPPAHWQFIGEVKKSLGVPVVANGEIWSLEDFKRCREKTGCDHFMLGRGAMADPNLVFGIQKELGLLPDGPTEPFGVNAHSWLGLFEQFAPLGLKQSPKNRYVMCRLKQWAAMAKARQTVPWFDAVKTAENLSDFMGRLKTLAEGESTPH